MISKTIAPTMTADTIERFPDFPPRDDMQNFIHLTYPTWPTTLHAHYGKSETTLVVSEVPISQEVPRSQLGVRTPDLMVAFGVAWSQVIAQRGYAIDEVGKPPDFVMEVASPHTARNDYTQKRVDYQNFGVPEYWRFDHTGGDLYDAALAGDELVDGRYQPIPVEWPEETRGRGYSRVLGLYLCWEEGELRFYDPVRDRYLPTRDEEADRANQADRRANREAARADQEAARAEYADRRANREAVRADQEAARADQADRRAAQEAAEVRRLRQMLRDLGHTTE